MRVCGIIAEYNPFHNGHYYHLEQAKKMTNADYIIVIMSGNFVQRGMPAMIDKYARTECALSCGADLVIELPVIYSLGSAEFFAQGAISILNQLNTVTHLCFGSEIGNIDILHKIANILNSKDEQFDFVLRRNLKTGQNYPTARKNALLQFYPDLVTHTDLLSSPNNILGIEYLKSLQLQQSSILPITLKRDGAGYHDKDLQQIKSSATAIRLALQNETTLLELKDHIPQSCYNILDDYFNKYQPLFIDDFSDLLFFKLILEKEVGYSQYLDINQDLSDRIKKNLNQFTTISSFCNLLKSKNLTYTRISRSLFHILLNIETSFVQDYINTPNLTPYTRVLGFKKESTSLLHKIKKQSSVPLITKLADANKILSSSASTLLRKDIETSHIYNSKINIQKGEPIRNEFRERIIII